MAPTRVVIPADVVKPREAPKVAAKPAPAPVSSAPVVAPEPKPFLPKQNDVTPSFPLSSPSRLASRLVLPDPRDDLSRVVPPKTTMKLVSREAPVSVREGEIGVHREQAVRKLNEELKKSVKRKVFTITMMKEKKERIT